MNENRQAQTALEKHYQDKFARVHQNLETANQKLLAHFVARVLKRIASYPDADRKEGLFAQKTV